MKQRFNFFSGVLFFLVLCCTLTTATSPGEIDYLATVHSINQQIKAGLGHQVKQLDIDLIMEGPNFFGTMPTHVRWDSDESRLWFYWKKWNETEPGTYEYLIATQQLRRLTPEEEEQIPSASAVWDNRHQKALWTVRDTLMLYDGNKKKSIPLVSGIGSTPPPPDYIAISNSSTIFYNKLKPILYVGSGALEPVTFSENSSKAILFFDNNLYSIILDGEQQGSIAKLTDIRKGYQPDHEPPTPSQKYIKAQQTKLLDVLQRRIDRKNREIKRINQARPNPLYLEGWDIYAMIPSNDLLYCAVLLSQSSPNARVANIPNFITASGYTETIPTYIKAGDESPKCKTGIIDLTNGRVNWVDFGFGERRVEPFYIQWHPKKHCALITIYSYDNKDAWLALVEPSRKKDQETNTLATRILFNEHDAAWVNPLTLTNFGWLPESEQAWFVSERSGWMQLYSISTKDSTIKSLTKGNFLVLSPQLVPDFQSPGKKNMMFLASEPSPFELHTYMLPLSGNKLRKLTSDAGRAEGTISPSGSYLAVVASRSDHPWELYIKKTDLSGLGTQVTDSPSPAFQSYKWIEPEIIHFKATDGTPIPARLYVPPNLHPKHPAVIFLHGGGWVHNVHRWWSTYSQEYCFHHLLMEKGYIVLDIDFRGSAGYGRDWRTSVYRKQIAGKISDVIDGSKYLAETFKIEPERIGVYGGSGGGVLTLMVLFTAPKHFGAGAALRSLPDIAHYAPGLSTKVLNSPQEDPEAYYRSSPIYYAEGLEDPLLICHGTSDVNTHFHGVMRLIQRLIELRKTNWELAVYPMESHSFTEPSSWADEYRRIFKLFEENLKK